ncbi:MAG TPA: 50S ribosomal protein L14 [Candidatus Deferrimicrobium sp.]|nr:50S ribosomal protein L14 [Candidatus Deferrimicrobium sp.]
MGKKRVRKKGAHLLPRISKGIPTNCRLLCSDNSGGKILKVIALVGYKGRLNRLPSAGVGSMVVVSVIKGTPEMRRQIVRAIIIRQRKLFLRSDGRWIQFEDNAAVITSPVGEPKGSEIRGAVAKEAAERWPRLASVASMVV